MLTVHKRILDNLSTAVALLDERLAIAYANPACEMLLETSIGRLMQSGLEAALPDPAELLEPLREAMATAHSFTRREAEFLLSTGTRLRVDYSVSPLPDGQHLLLEFQTRERLLRISREEDMLAQQETTRMLVRSMAHEIKNPLGGIRGAAQLLDRELIDPSLKDYTQVIIEEADRLRSLVDRLLGPNRAPKLVPTNIHEILERVRTLIDAESGGVVRFERDYDPSLPEFMGDKEQLIQAFLNIARNAWQAISSIKTPNMILRTRALRQFTIGHTRHRLVCRVDIIDNGPGIPPELAQSLFYPMISGRPDGTGLGLAITQSIIGQHHGLVECDSEPGHTDFIVFLPLEPLP